jgi:hypothetical protein
MSDDAAQAASALEDEGSPFVIETETLGTVRLPHMRVLAYEPQSSHKMALMIGGADLLEAISSNGVVDEELLHESRRMLLAKHLIKCLRMQRKRNAPPVLRLLSLTEHIEDEKRVATEEDAVKRLADVAERKRQGQAKRSNAKEEEERRARIRSGSQADNAKRLKDLEDELEQARRRGSSAHDLEQIEALMERARRAASDEYDSDEGLEPWERAAKFVNRRWKEGANVEGHTLVVTASAVNASTVKGAMNRNELWSSESELDFSDEAIDMSRSELRLMVTVYSPSLAETASAVVPTIVVSQLLGAPLEHLNAAQLAGGLNTLLRYADIKVRDDDAAAAMLAAEAAAGAAPTPRDVGGKNAAEQQARMKDMLVKDRANTAGTMGSDFSEMNALPSALEPRLTFAIDPALPPRQRAAAPPSAGAVKISSVPGMPSVSTVGEQIYHRAMRIDGDTDTEDKPWHYLLMRIFAGVGSRGRSYRIEAYFPKLSHSAQITMSEPRFNRLIAGRTEMLLAGDGRADFLAMVLQNSLVVKNALILAHMRLIVRRCVSVAAGVSLEVSLFFFFLFLSLSFLSFPPPPASFFSLRFPFSCSHHLCYHLCYLFF